MAAVSLTSQYQHPDHAREMGARPAARVDRAYRRGRHRAGSRRYDAGGPGTGLGELSAKFAKPSVTLKPPAERGQPLNVDYASTAVLSAPAPMTQVHDRAGPGYAAGQPHFRPRRKLPRSPRARERYEYFQRRRRQLVAVVLSLMSTGSLYGMWAVFSKSLTWLPCLLTLAVAVPWAAWTITLALFRAPITRRMHERISAGTSQDLASVDVFVMTCGEDLDVLSNTFAHVSALKWRVKINIYVADDGASPQVREMSRRFGFCYMSRPTREFKKAGNMNYAFDRSGGEYVVVFDADFAPAPDFLFQVIPYFADPQIGIVQTAQYFDTDRKRTANWLARQAGTVQDMFFTWVQPARNATGSAFCVGTNVAYRRSALVKVGGFPQVAGGEDIVTTWDLMSIGYRTLYLPLNLAKGLCPDTFAATINQQYRWCISSLDMFIPANRGNVARNSFYGCRMSPMQRISFLSGILYYLQSIVALVTGVAPSLIMIWFYPYQVGPGNYLPILPAMLGLTAMPILLRGWRPQMLRTAMIYSTAHLLALVDSLTRHAVAWSATGAKSHGNRTPLIGGVFLRSWVVLTQAAAWTGLARDIPVYGWHAYWPAVLLAAFQTVVLFPLLLPSYGVAPVRPIIVERLRPARRNRACLV
jgi:cellulose synthase (UDP-forming)